jgi:Fe-S cluster assembly protein SufD
MVTEKNLPAIVAASVEQTVAQKKEAMAIRTKALDNFLNLGLPGNKSEEYKHTPVTRLLEKNFDFTVQNPAVKEFDVDKFRITGIDANVLVFINGVYSTQLSTVVSPESEIKILPLEEALRQNHATALQHFAQYADYSADGLAAWNTAAWNSGLFIEVGANTVVEKPVFMYNIHDVREGQVISMMRHLFVVGRNSSLTVLEKLDSEGNGNGFGSVITEAVVAENATFNFYAIQNDSGNRYQYAYTQLHQANHSRVNTYTFTMDGKLVRNNLQLALDGEGIESHMYGLYLLHNDTLADNHTVVDHKKPHSFSNELYKGILDDQSKGVFNGKIYVRPQAQKTNAFQANRNILLTNQATINTKPQLEIWADDVKCSHGCTTGQLDEEALFYLQARGISKETARAMMLYAFAGELVETIKDPVLQRYIDSLISERLHKNF